MLNIVFYGAPACGKGTQAKIIKEKYNLYHINTGQLLREEIDKGSKLGETISSYIDNGNLVPDDISTKIVKTKYKEVCNNSYFSGCIFDGFPRSGVQTKNLFDIVKSEGENINLFVEFHLPNYLIFERLKKRAEIEGRKDDQSKEKIQRRIEHYLFNRKDIIYSFKQSIPYIDIDASKDIEVITKLITKHI